ncbi:MULTISPECIES: ABC transporter substrate-binding protein [unclassified Chelatococcus]|uniref:ABC transporter substrate-binding protein n=1 Tax=unclassified Chelatococcus TaxID=2638111 RepID=UPI001BCC8FB2|nr:MULTISPECIES: ABC transporter substrate-binding protein [unclassified Chelatococcus]CAH1655337.1 Glycerol-3-phosphate ABC transporter, periplasmic glycerol-3-phosphate-binding protein (TC 3.A.1.1.3) [Hyphomicrobiales bacterium]MBS7742625.1 ABC transporter substrate-binding protein [Chelatococcus sp. HY11]MBX3542257.1 ABC transporter substrate-binding protein [Chelatococcus sp.]MCO5075525.1 ABC transporter substrate-binding protein [Chelatococcus sp.]CAH1695433.1 Glycerol-3-phosphate ABC tra
MHRRTFGKLTLGFAGVLLASTAMAQSIPATVDKPVEITFYNYNLAMAGSGQDGTNKMIKEFEQLHPSIKVKGVGVTSPEIASRTQADIVAGRGPDVAQIIFKDLDYIARNFNAKALEDIIPANEREEHFAGMVKAGLDLGKIGNKTYALAYTFSTPMLFYNADIFRAAGLDPDKPPRTWAEIKQAATTIQEKTSFRGFGADVVGASGGADDWLMQSLIYSNGGRVLSEDRKRLTFAEPEAVEVAAMLRDLVKSGLYRNEPNGANADGMASGKFGMMLTTAVRQATFVKGATGKWELRAVGMPAFGEKETAPTNSGSGLVIFSDDPVKQRASWELMKFLTSKRGYTIITSEIGYVPLRLDIVDDPQYLGEWTKKHPLVRPNLEQLARLRPWVSYPGQNYKQIHNTFMSAMEQAVFGDGDVKQTLQTAQDRAQRLIPAN